jgi:EAL and modified HD-GYP domain-containing signal transduction protein
MHQRFIARQPIFDKRLNVYAYELLFRSGPQNYFQPSRNATSSVIAESVSRLDLEKLTGTARAFVNVDELALRLGAPRLLPPERIVVEILETVRPTEEILQICRELVAAGYVLALDDFVDNPETVPLVEVAQFLKVDFQLLDTEARERLAGKYGSGRFDLLAEKVETERELSEARRLGFSYFQGYFFCKPSMIETREIPGNKLLQLELLDSVAAPELDDALFEELLEREPSLLYRLLRYLNSPELGLGSEVHNVHQAISLLGKEEFRRSVAIFAVVTMSSGKPLELVRTALTRAYFCEEFSCSAGLGEHKADLFLMGLLSTSDALLDTSIADVLRSVSVSEDVKTALTGGANRFRDVYELLLALERAEWSELAIHVQRLGCDEEKIPDSYQAAIQKASSISL